MYVSNNCKSYRCDTIIEFQRISDRRIFSRRRTTSGMNSREWEYRERYMGIIKSAWRDNDQYGRMRRTCDHSGDESRTSGTWHTTVHPSVCCTAVHGISVGKRRSETNRSHTEIFISRKASSTIATSVAGCGLKCRPNTHFVVEWHYSSDVLLIRHSALLLFRLLFFVFNFTVSLHHSPLSSVYAGKTCAQKHSIQYMQTTLQRSRDYLPRQFPVP